MAERARYVYAIGRGFDSSALDGERGLDDVELEVVEHRGLAAVVSDVDLEDYGEDGLRRNLERLEWLEETARCHDRVVQLVGTLGPTAPLRLATICLDDAGVRARLDEWFHALVQVLDRVEGRREWSVKVLVPPRPVAVPADAVPTDEPLSGAAYLQRKKAATQARRVSEDESLRVAEHVYVTLGEASVASRRLPAQDPRLTGHVGTMVLNAAYLVGDDDGAAFAARAEVLQSEHPDLTVDVRGPWPPYSFAMLEQR